MNKVRKFDLKALAASAVLFAILQGLMSAEVIGPFWELNLILICMNVILASSLNMINGFTGQFSIGHAGFLAVGAYMGAVMTVKLGFSFPLAIVAGTVAAGFLGFLIGLPTLRLDGDYLAIATLGLGEIIRICILNIEYIGGASGLMGIPRMTNFTITFWLMIAVLFFIKNFKNSAHGRACLAIRENEIAADTMGNQIQSHGLYPGRFLCRDCRGAVLPLLLHRPSGVLHLHAFFRYPDHGSAGRSGFPYRFHHRRHPADLYLCGAGRFPGMAYDYLLTGHDYPDAVPSPGTVR